MSEKSDFLGTGMKFPVETRENEIATASDDDLIRESVLIILGTAKGERVMRPDFGCGIHELVFAPNSTSTAALVAFHVKEALLQWEPRIEVVDVNAVSDSQDPSRLNINVEYNIKKSNTKRNLVYPFYLEAAG